MLSKHYFKSVWENSRLKNIAIFTFIILMSVVYLLKLPMTSVDPFHTGEYFVAAVNIESGLNSFTIHGMVNYLPALITKYIYGQDYIAPTVLSIRFIALLSSLMLTLICYNLLSKNQSKVYICLIMLAISLTFISHRDLFLLISIYLFIKVIGLRSDHQTISNYHQIFFGLAMAITLFWTFDRGITAIVSIGVAYVFYIVQSKQYYLIKAILSFVFFILFLNFTFDATSLEHYVNNVLSLVKSSSQWQYGYSFLPAILTIFAGCVLFITIFNSLKSFSLNKDIKDKAFLILLFILSLFLFKSSINRADTSHIMLNFLPLFLLISFTLGKDQKITFIPFLCNKSILHFLLVCFIAAGMFGLYLKSMSIVIFSFLLIFITDERFKSFFNNMSMLLLIVLSVLNLRVGYKQIAKGPSEKLASEGNYWVYEMLIKNDTKCIFDLTNNGIINALSNLPTCTSYSYLIYTPYEDEHLLLNELKANKPNTIVYSTTYYSYRIDGKSMKDRYPKIDNFIKKNYKHTNCKFEYCIMTSIEFN